MLVGVVGLLNVSMYVFVSMVFVSLCMEILLTSVMPCGLRRSLISSREHDARSLGLGGGMFLCLVSKLFPF